MKLDHLATETRNARTFDLDEMGTEALLRVMNAEDAKVASAVEKEISRIAQAVELVVQARNHGGRLIYMGAGTSGRLGVLDAVECPPTFGVDPGEVVGLIAGGERAFVKAVEGAEDDEALGAADLERIKLTDVDVVVGLAASGRTPYVIGGLKYANAVGAQTVAIACNKPSEIGALANVAIEIENGPEVLTGSTRLKAGTSQKLVCNMISTASMVGTGKVFGNLMVDMQLTNEKLVERGIRMIMVATECDRQTAIDGLKRAGDNPKLAILMILTGATKEEATVALAGAGGFIKKALK